ncbi:MAG: hypothetical protein GY708_12140 [Actinomycetia bacterium]|nr:hypothetical protein [Actinomycetes bacterium]
MITRLALALLIALGGSAGADLGRGAAPHSASRTAGTGEVFDVDDLAEIEALLDARVEAILASDVDALALTRSPSATTSLVEADSRTIRGATLLGLDLYSEELAYPVVDLSPPGSPGPVLAVMRTHRISAIDATDHVGYVYLTFVLEGGEWSIAADDALTELGLYGDRALWELADVEVVRGERSVVVGTVARTRLVEVGGLLDEALVRFDREWTRPWVGRVAVMVPSDLAEVERLLRPTVDVSKFVAFTTLDALLVRVDSGTDTSDRGWNVVAPRIVLQESNFGRRSKERQIEVFVHELAHVASVQSSGPMTPLWMHEGLADWVTAERPTTGSDGDAVVFPDLHLFRTGSVSQIGSVYDQASRTMAQLAGSFGVDTPITLFEAVGSAHLVPGTSDRVLADTVADLLGVDISDLAGR